MYWVVYEQLCYKLLSCGNVGVYDSAFLLHDKKKM